MNLIFLCNNIMQNICSDPMPLCDELMPLCDELMPLNNELMPLCDELMPLNNELMPLCDDLLAAIFAYNNPIDHCRIRRVCRRFAALKLHGYIDNNDMIYEMMNTQLCRDGISTTLMRWVNNKMDGRQYLWMNSGKFSSCTNYVMGREIGISIHKNQYGRMEINNDGPNNTEILRSYGANGVIEYEISRERDQKRKHGICMKYINGVLVRIKVYNMGNCIDTVRLVGFSLG